MFPIWSNSHLQAEKLKKKGQDNAGTFLTQVEIKTNLIFYLSS